MYRPVCVIAFALGVAISCAAGAGPELSAVAICQEKPAAGRDASSTDSELQAEIQNTLDKEPSLAGVRVRATVTEQQIELAGSVPRNRDKLTAGRLALSYGANRKLVNRITVTGGAGKAPEAAASPPPRRGGKSPNKRNPALTPEPGKSLRPPLP